MLAIQYEAYGLKGTIYAKCMTDVSLTSDQHLTMKTLNHSDKPFDLFIANEKSNNDGALQQLQLNHPALNVYDLEALYPTNTNQQQWYILKRISDQRARKVGAVRVNDLTRDALKIDSVDGIILAQKLAIQLSLGVGPLSGIHLLAAITLQLHFGIDLVIATILPDNYLQFRSASQHTDFREDSHRYSHDIAFLGYTVFNGAFI